MRWQHPEFGLVPPNYFIELAEKSDCISDLTNRVAAMALHQCAEWNRQNFKVKVSINLSANDLVNLRYPDTLADDAKHYDVATDQLVLEITESGLFRDKADALEILARFSAQRIFFIH